MGRSGCHPSQMLSGTKADRPDPNHHPTHQTHQTKQALLGTMEATGADFTQTFLGLMALDPSSDGSVEEVRARAA
jgi:hypothetical protein